MKNLTKSLLLLPISLLILLSFAFSAEKVLAATDCADAGGECKFFCSTRNTISTTQCDSLFPSLLCCIPNAPTPIPIPISAPTPILTDCTDSGGTCKSSISLACPPGETPKASTNQCSPGPFVCCIPNLPTSAPALSQEGGFCFSTADCVSGLTCTSDNPAFGGTCQKPIPTTGPSDGCQKAGGICTTASEACASRGNFKYRGAFDLSLCPSNLPQCCVPGTPIPTPTCGGEDENCCGGYGGSCNNTGLFCDPDGACIPVPAPVLKWQLLTSCTAPTFAPVPQCTVNDVSQCKAEATECREGGSSNAQCSNGKCVYNPKPNDTPCKSGGKPGNCQAGECNTQGTECKGIQDGFKWKCQSNTCEIGKKLNTTGFVCSTGGPFCCGTPQPIIPAPISPPATGPTPILFHCETQNADSGEQFQCSTVNSCFPLGAGWNSLNLPHDCGVGTQCCIKRVLTPIPTPIPSRFCNNSATADNDCFKRYGDFCAVGSSCGQNPLNLSRLKDCICQSDTAPIPEPTQTPTGCSSFTSCSACITGGGDCGWNGSRCQAGNESCPRGETTWNFFSCSQNLCAPTPTRTPTPRDTILAIIINRGLIGAEPTHKHVVYNVLILDAEQKEVKRVKGIIDAFDSISNSFKDNLIIDDPNSAFPTGSFSIKIKLNKYLAKLIPGSTITSGTVNSLPATSPIVGDISGDNRIDIVDYNALVGCFGKKSVSDSCINKSEPQSGDSGTDYNADLNDDGVVDGIDYNIFLKSLNLRVSGD